MKKLLEKNQNSSITSAQQFFHIQDCVFLFASIVEYNIDKIKKPTEKYFLLFLGKKCFLQKCHSTFFYSFSNKNYNFIIFVAIEKVNIHS